MWPRRPPARGTDPTPHGSARAYAGGHGCNPRCAEPGEPGPGGQEGAEPGYGSAVARALPRAGRCPHSAAQAGTSVRGSEPQPDLFLSGAQGVPRPGSGHASGHGQLCSRPVRKKFLTGRIMAQPCFHQVGEPRRRSDLWRGHSTTSAAADALASSPNSSKVSPGSRSTSRAPAPARRIGRARRDLIQTTSCRCARAATAEPGESRRRRSALARFRAYSVSFGDDMFGRAYSRVGLASLAVPCRRPSRGSAHPARRAQVMQPRSCRSLFISPLLTILEFVAPMPSRVAAPGERVVAGRARAPRRD